MSRLSSLSAVETGGLLVGGLPAGVVEVVVVVGGGLVGGVGVGPQQFD
jgi:hypothetical protein